jgi:hypothetical protein
MVLENDDMVSSQTKFDITYLQLSESEATAGTNAAVVLDGRASHNGLQLVDGSGSDGGGLGLTGGAS